MPSKETLLEAGNGEKTEKVATTYRHFVIFERKKKKEIEILHILYLAQNLLHKSVTDEADEGLSSSSKQKLVIWKENLKPYEQCRLEADIQRTLRFCRRSGITHQIR